MQNVNKYHSLGDRLGVVRLALGSTKRRLQSADAALGVKLLNVPLAELAIHYHETQLFIQEAIGHVANAFAVDPQRVVPLQLRPDEREPTKCTIWTFTIRGIPFHDLLGQMREMFEHSKVAFGEWRFGSRKVELEPLILGVPGVLSNVSLQTPPTVWQRPGLDAEWEQEAELWIKLRDFKWLEELKSSVSQFERRLLKLRDVVASTMKVKDPRALQVAKYYSTSDGTIIRMTPATPDKREHIEQLKKWLLAFESGEVNQKVPEVSEDFWPIRSPKTGRPLSLSIFSSSTTSSTVTPLAHRVIVSRDDYSYETPKAPLPVDEELAPSTKPFPGMDIIIPVAVLAVFLGFVVLCIFCCRRRGKATTKSPKPPNGGSPATTGSLKATAGSRECTATGRQRQAGGKASTPHFKRKGYAGS